MGQPEDGGSTPHPAAVKVLNDARWPKNKCLAAPEETLMCTTCYCRDFFGYFGLHATLAPHG